MEIAHRKFNYYEKEYIESKVPDMEWYLIPMSIKIFWAEWREKNENNGKRDKA